jgi:hypothetical protein
VAAPSKAQVCELSLAWIVGFNSDGASISVLCWQVEVSVTGRSLIQSSPTECCVSVCVISKPKKWGVLGPSWAVVSQQKKYIYNLRFSKMIKGNIKQFEKQQNTELLHYLRLISCGSLESKLTSTFNLSLPKQKFGRLSYYLQISLSYLMYFFVLVIFA